MKRTIFALGSVAILASGMGLSTHAKADEPTAKSNEIVAEIAQEYKSSVQSFTAEKKVEKEIALKEELKASELKAEKKAKKKAKDKAKEEKSVEVAYEDTKTNETNETNYNNEQEETYEETYDDTYDNSNAHASAPVQQVSNDGLNWAGLAACESGGNPNIVDASGTYHGLYQFDAGTWQAMGGTGVASQASAEEQTMRAQMLYAQRGAQPWPTCGAYL